MATIISALACAASGAPSLNVGSASVRWIEDGYEHQCVMLVDLPEWELNIPVMCGHCGAVPHEERVIRKWMAAYLTEHDLAHAEPGMWRAGARYIRVDDNKEE